MSDFLVSDLSCYPKIWRKYFNNDGTLNFGIAGAFVSCFVENS